MTDATQQAIVNTVETGAKWITRLAPLIIGIAAFAAALALGDHRLSAVEEANRAAAQKVATLENDFREMKTDIRWIRRAIENDQRRSQ
jgi:hypothetical protein